MDLVKILRIVYWVLAAIMVSIFYYSLRYAGEQAMEFTLLALVFWAAAFLLNRYIQKIQKKEGDD